MADGMLGAQGAEMTNVVQGGQREQMLRAIAELQRRGIPPTRERVMEMMALMGRAQPAPNAGMSSGTGLGQRTAPEGSAEARAEASAAEKRKKGAAGLTPEQKKRFGLK